jgi:hypothetical protein
MNEIERVDPREARQPRWIRNTLFQLRMRLGEAERRIAEQGGHRESREVWLLTVGEYADHSVLGVVIGDERTAKLRAAQLTKKFVELKRGQYEVQVEKAEVLS